MNSPTTLVVTGAPSEPVAPARVPYGTCIVVGLGGLFAGVTGPLLSAFVPLLVQAAIGERPTAIGAVMAIDNVLLLLLVPWAGAASDRASGRGRLVIVLAGFVLASAGMALFASPVVAGITGLLAAMVLLYTGINIQRSPFQPSWPTSYRRGTDRLRPARGCDHWHDRVGGWRRGWRAAGGLHRQPPRQAKRHAPRVRAVGRVSVRAQQRHDHRPGYAAPGARLGQWTLPTVNAYPLFVEPVPRHRLGVLAALFLLCMALGGAIGDPLNGSIFDLAGSYQPLFLLMAGYTALAFIAVLFIPRGTGEADTGPQSATA
jgi:MFS family permease